MKLDVLGLQAFAAIADQGTFSRAAQSLHITQTGLTRRLQSLEQVLGVRLVERTTRSSVLTAVGMGFLPRARRLLRELESAFTEVREGGRAQRGDVTIACVPTAGVQFLPRIVKRYAERHPENRIRILDHSSVDVAAAVARREAEFGINIAGSGHPDLVATPLVSDRFVLACRRDHPLARSRALAWKQLRAHPLIFVGHVSGNRQLLDAALGEGEVQLQIRYEVQRSSTALGLAMEGLGAAIVPAMAVQPGAYPEIRVIPLSAPVVSRRLVLLVRRNASLSPAAEALFALLRSARD